MDQKVSENKRRVKAVFTGLIGSFLLQSTTILSQILFVPILIGIGGTAVFSSYNIVLQIIGFSAIFDLGINVSIGRYLAKTIPSCEENELGNILKACQQLNSRVCFIIGIVYILIGYFYGLIISSDSFISVNIKECLLLYGIWTMVKGRIFVYSHIIIGEQKLIHNNLILAVGIIIRLGVSYLLLINGFSVKYLMFSIIISELITYLCQMSVCSSMMPKRRNWIVADSVKEEIIQFGKKYWGVNVSSVMILGMDLFILSGFYSDKLLAKYITVKMLGSVSITFITKFIDQIYPAIAELSHKNEEKTIHLYYRLVSKVVLILFSFYCFNIFLVGKEILYYWTNGNVKPGLVMIFGNSVYVFIQSINHLNGIFMLGLGCVQNWGTFSILVGLLNVTALTFYSYLFPMDYIFFVSSLASFPLTIFSFYKLSSATKLRVRFSFKSNLFNCFGIFILAFLIFLFNKLQAVAGTTSYLYIVILGNMILAMFFLKILQKNKDYESIKQIVKSC